MANLSPLLSFSSKLCKSLSGQLADESLTLTQNTCKTASPMQQPKQFRAASGAIAVLLLLAIYIYFSTPAQAIIQAQAWDWLARLNRLIPAAERSQCDECAASLPLESDVQQLEEAVALLNLKLHPKPLCLYTAIRLLIRQDRYLETLDYRLETNKKGQDILRSYRRTLNRSLKGLNRSSSADPIALPAPHYDYTKIIDTETEIEVLRPLPKFKQGWHATESRTYLKAAASDLKFLENQAKELQEEREHFRKLTLPLRYYVRELGNSLDPSTGLPKPAGHIDSTIDLVLPPPPVDLKPLTPLPAQ